MAHRLSVPLVILVATAALAAGCGTRPAAPADATGPEKSAWRTPDADDLRAYGSCAALRRDLTAREADEVDPALDAPSAYYPPRSLNIGPREVNAAVPTRGSVAEDGVDEPRWYVSDGRLLVHADYEKLRLYDVSGDAPAARGVLDLGKAAGMTSTRLLLAGDRALVIGVERPTGPRSSGARAVRGPPSGASAPHPARARRRLRPGRTDPALRPARRGRVRRGVAHRRDGARGDHLPRRPERSARPAHARPARRVVARDEHEVHRRPAHGRGLPSGHADGADAEPRARRRLSHRGLLRRRRRHPGLPGPRPPVPRDHSGSDRAAARRTRLRGRPGGRDLVRGQRTPRRLPARRVRDVGARRPPTNRRQ